MTRENIKAGKSKYKEQQKKETYNEMKLIESPKIGNTKEWSTRLSSFTPNDVNGILDMPGAVFICVHKKVTSEWSIIDAPEHS